jgi:hypothetical protein
VHFCPVVSEVSWRESFSDEDPQDDDDAAGRALCALEKGEDVTVPPKQTLLLQKIQIGVPVGPGSGERERVVMELKQEDSTGTPTGTEGHVGTSSMPATTSSSYEPNAVTVHVVSMETKQQKSPGSSRECSGDSSRCDSDSSPAAASSASGGKKSGGGGGRFGGFFQRFSFRRLSGRVVGNNGSSKKQKEEKKKADAKSRSCEKRLGAATGAEYEDVTIIPLHPPPGEAEEKPAPVVVVSSKPPLPPLPPRSVSSVNKPVPSPRRRPDAHDPAPPATTSGLQLQGKQDSASMPLIDPIAASPPPGKRAAAGLRPPLGLLETDIDADISTVRPQQNGAAPSNKKARSLLNLGDMSTGCIHNGAAAMLLKPPPGGSTNRPLTPADSRAKSMEFLLDKENQAAVQVGTLFAAFISIH